MTASIDDFWHAGAELRGLEISPLAAERPDALLRRLGPLRPSGTAELDLVTLLAPSYTHLAAAAERRALAE